MRRQDEELLELDVRWLAQHAKHADVHSLELDHFEFRFRDAPRDRLLIAFDVELAPGLLDVAAHRRFDNPIDKIDICRSGNSKRQGHVTSSLTKRSASLLSRRTCQ